MFDRIAYNSRFHDMIAPLYEARHGEIYNQVEQLRICGMLECALKSIQAGSEVPRVLDFGAGTGNLTHHLLNSGAAVVVASDVSSGCLRELKSSIIKTDCLEFSLLNGNDLSQFADESFDMVATYSVLHHVPDYISIVNEFIRVLKPGGVVYIDHEVCPAYWENRPEYLTYCREVTESQFVLSRSLFQSVLHVFRQKYWWRYLVSALWLKWNKVTDEGDIHVHADDHIEWTKIRDCLEPLCEIVREQDYLVCRERTYPPPVWEKWRDHCADMRLIVARKR